MKQFINQSETSILDAKYDKIIEVRTVKVGNSIGQIFVVRLA